MPSCIASTTVTFLAIKRGKIKLNLNMITFTRRLLIRDTISRLKDYMFIKIYSSKHNNPHDAVIYIISQDVAVINK